MRYLFTLAFLLLLYTSNAQQIKSFNQYNGGSRLYTPLLFTEFNSKLYFAGGDSASGGELYCIDKNDKISLVADINPGYLDGVIYFSFTGSGGPRASMLVAPVRNADNLFFFANDGVHGNELYNYDGINPPSIVAEAVPGSGGLTLGNSLVNINEFVYAGLGDTIYEYDAVSKTVHKYYQKFSNAIYAFNNKIYTLTSGDSINEFDPKSKSSKGIKLGESPHMLESIDGKLYIGCISSKNGYGHLFEYDGSSLKNVGEYLQTQGSGNQLSNALIGGNNHKIYFPCPNVKNNFPCPCEYDPISGKTTHLSPNDTLAAYCSYFTSFGNKIYFAARDSSEKMPITPNTSNFELWSYEEGNHSLNEIDIIPGPTIGCDPQYFYPFNGSLFFSGHLTNKYPVIYKYTPGTSSVKNLSFKGDAILFPNPTTGNATLRIDIKDDLTAFVSIVDANGREVYKSAPENYGAGITNIELPITTLPIGNYFYRLSDKDGNLLFSGKIVKQ